MASSHSEKERGSSALGLQGNVLTWSRGGNTWILSGGYKLGALQSRYWRAGLPFTGTQQNCMQPRDGKCKHLYLGWKNPWQYRLVGTKAFLRKGSLGAAAQDVQGDAGIKGFAQPGGGQSKAGITRSYFSCCVHTRSNSDTGLALSAVFAQMISRGPFQSYSEFLFSISPIPFHIAPKFLIFPIHLCIYANRW